MSLFNLDKDSDGRSVPRINHNDVVSNPLAHNTMSTTYKSDGDSNKQRVVFKNNITLYYDDQNRVIKVDGFIPDLVDYPVTIQAQYGYDVYTDILGLTAPTT